MRKIFSLPVMNILWLLLTGDRFDYEDDNLSNYVEKLNNSIRRMTRPANILKITFPYLARIISSSNKMNNKHGDNEDIIGILQNMVNDHQQTLNLDYPRDLTDHLLIGRLQNQTNDLDIDDDVEFEGTVNTILDLLLAGVGSESISGTLTWAVLHLANHQDIQNRVYKEISQVLGNKQRPSLENRLGLPYTEVTY